MNEDKKEAPAKKPKGLIYTGGGGGRRASLQDPRVPARDLSSKEVKKYGRDLLLKSGLYIEPEGGKK